MLYHTSAMKPPACSPALPSGLYHDEMHRPGLDEHRYVTDGECAIRVEFTTALVPAAAAQRILDVIASEMQHAESVTARALSLIS